MSKDEICKYCCMQDWCTELTKDYCRDRKEGEEE
jgi:hypothetical protein